MFSLSREIERLLEKYPDPRRGSEGVMAFNKRQIADACFPRPGVVADNKDPLCLGRVRVACDMIAPGAVTGWIHVLSQGAGKNCGWWLLPDIGTQVILAFLWNSIDHPIVIGSIYDLKHRPPKHSTENPADSIVWQTKNHRLEIIDEEGKESFILSTKKGQMRIVLSKDKGIELVNELGDIRIKCRKLKIEGGEETSLQAKKLSISSEGTLGVHSSKNTKLNCDKEVKLKGKNVKLNASKGITTEGKQLAAEGDKVMGFDIHKMVVPSGSGTSIVPLPHPFLGKLADGLSNNVKINGHNAAVKGSKAKHDNPVHNQLPGTIKFQTGPKKEGEVTNGTGKKVKINGKEVAVIGSTVTTCNDVGAKDNSAILAVGAAMPMPVIINPKNTAEYLREREESQLIHPEFTQAQWGKGTAKEGEEVELLASVKDIAEGNAVVFQVWGESQDPSTHIALAQVTGAVEGGSAKGRWTYKALSGEQPPEKDPKFYFTAHSAWCPFMKGNTLTVELQRPEITAVKWLDKEEKETEKNVLGEPVKLSGETKDIEDGKTVTFKIYSEGANTKKDKPVKILDGTVKSNKVETTYNFAALQPKPAIDEALYRYYKSQGYDIPREEFELFLDDYGKEIKSETKEKPKYIYTASARRCADVTSGAIEVSKTLKITYLDAFGEPVKDVKIKVKESDGTEHNGATDEEGTVEFSDLIPTNNYFDYTPPENDEKGE